MIFLTYLKFNFTLTQRTFNLFALAKFSMHLKTRFGLVSCRFRYWSDFEHLTNSDRKSSLPSQFEMSMNFKSKLCSMRKFKSIGKTSQFRTLRYLTFDFTIFSMNSAGITLNQACTFSHRDVFSNSFHSVRYLVAVANTFETQKGKYFENNFIRQYFKLQGWHFVS